MRAGFLLRCQNSLRQTTPDMMHFQAWKKKDFYQYYVVAFDPTKIYVHQAPQNDHLNFSFVKDVYVVYNHFNFSIAAQMSQAPQLSAYYQYLLSDPGLQSILSLAGCVSDPSRALV